MRAVVAALVSMGLAVVPQVLPEELVAVTVGELVPLVQLTQLMSQALGAAAAEAGAKVQPQLLRLATVPTLFGLVPAAVAAEVWTLPGRRFRKAALVEDRISLAALVEQQGITAALEPQQ
jgi:hypothetical protein